MDELTHGREVRFPSSEAYRKLIVPSPVLHRVGFEGELDSIAFGSCQIFFMRELGELQRDFIDRCHVLVHGHHERGSSGVVLQESQKCSGSREIPRVILVQGVRAARLRIVHRAETFVSGETHKAQIRRSIISH